MSVVGKTSPFCANLNEHHAGHYQTDTFLPTWSDEYFSKRIVDLVAAVRLRDGDSLWRAYVRAWVGLTSGKHQRLGGGAACVDETGGKRLSSCIDSMLLRGPRIVREAISPVAPSGGLACVRSTDELESCIRPDPGAPALMPVASRGVGRECSGSWPWGAVQA